MSDITVSIIAEQMGKDLENLAPQVEAELNHAVESLANAAYAAIIAKIQSMDLDPKNRADYLKGLDFVSLNKSSWLISLDGDWANKLEKGFESYSIKDELLKSEKTVQVGSRAGKPWVRVSKDGNKYAAVPFQHRPHGGKSPSLASEIKKIMVANRSGEMQSMSKIFKDSFGKPIHGEVARVKEVPNNPNLSGLVKYQQVGKNGKVSSIYMTYRMVSENSDGWQHPGFEGYQLFKEAEDYVETELKNILSTLL